MKMFYLDQDIQTPDGIGRICYLKTYGRGLLDDCQLAHVRVKGEYKDTFWRVFRWRDGTLGRMTRIER